MSASGSQLDPALQETIKDLKLIQQCGDDQFARPIIVFAAANLPDPKAISYESLLQYMTEQVDLVVESDYVVVLFYQGMQYRPSWTWLRQTYDLLGRKYKKNLKNLYVVHPTMWHKLMMQVVNFFISSKFLDKIVYINRLTDLDKHVPVSQLYIPQAVRSYDSKYYGPATFVPRKGTMNEKAQFGVPIGKLMEGGKFPLVLLETADCIRKEGIKVTGLFRRSPSQATLLEVIDKYNRGETVKLEEYDIHIAAVLLKRFFRDLPESLIPIRNQPLLEDLKSSGSAEKRLEATRQIVNDLPNENRVILAFLIQLLTEVAEHSDENLMTVNNLAIVFGPNLLPTEITLADLGASTIIVQVLIVNYEVLFSGVLQAYFGAEGVSGKGKIPIEGLNAASSKSEEEEEKPIATDSEDAAAKKAEEEAAAKKKEEEAAAAAAAKKKAEEEAAAKKKAEEEAAAAAAAKKKAEEEAAAAAKKKAEEEAAAAAAAKKKAEEEAAAAAAKKKAEEEAAAAAAAKKAEEEAAAKNVISITITEEDESESKEGDLQVAKEAAEKLYESALAAHDQFAKQQASAEPAAPRGLEALTEEEDFPHPPVEVVVTEDAPIKIAIPDAEPIEIKVTEEPANETEAPEEPSRPSEEASRPSLDDQAEGEEDEEQEGTSGQAQGQAAGKKKKKNKGKGKKGK